MLKPQFQTDAQDADRTIYPDLPNHVAAEADFIAAVQAGIASYETGPTHDLDSVEAELQALLQHPA